MTARQGPRSARPRSQAHYGPQRGTTYLIHFARPFKHARHYKGWTDRPVQERFADHLAGRGAVLTRLVAQAGIGMTLARIWPDTTKDREDAIKRSGGKRMCPECGVTPGRTRLASDQPPAPDDRRPMWQMDRDGEWADDGTPIIYDPAQTWAQARAEAERHPVRLTDEDREELAALDELERRWTDQEEHVNLRDAARRVADTVRGRRQTRDREAAAAEANRLWAIADELDKQQGRQPGHQYALTAERAARIRAQIGEDLVRDARAHAQAGEGSHEPELQGAERDAEIDRLAGQFGEPDPLFGPRLDGTYAAAIDSDIVAHASGAGQLAAWNAQFAAGHVPDERDGASAQEVAAWEQWAWQQGERENAQARAEQEQRWPESEIDAPGPEPGWDAATWSPALEDSAADPDAEISDFPYLTARPADLAPERYTGDDLARHAARAEALHQSEARALARAHIAQGAHDAGLAEAARAQARQLRQARLGAEADAYSAAATLHAAAAFDTPGQPDYYRSAPGSAEHREAYRQMHAEADGAGFADPDPDTSYEIDNAYELAAERYYEQEAERHYGADYDPEPEGGAGAGDTDHDGPDHLYGAPWCAEADPEGTHFGYTPGEPQDAGRWVVMPIAGPPSGLQADYGRIRMTWPYPAPPPGQPQAEAV